MEEDQLHHLYKSGSTFEQAINLYLFDKELRQLIFKAIQDIEHTNCQNSYKCATQKSSCKRGITYRPDVIHYDYNRRKARFYDSTPRRVLHLLP
ncbi:Abi family protein [Prevotella copri]|uniref:Abi family protein n=1 Tax=Segatella copri TaxID=165179 RepID=UPI002230D2C1|nr:Abi family protein [Segatella copri]MCW4117371.1 Abi family protein [Segatella copri]